MKRRLLIIALFLTANVTFAIFINNFKSWDDLIEQSPDIVIARCSTTLDTTKSKKPIAITDGMIPSDIQVLSVLKGNTKPGPARMVSQYWPYPSEEFLLFANYETGQFYKGYTAVESYRVVPVNRDFQTNQLAGKTLHEQVQLILNSRLKYLNDELERDSEEERRIEMNMSSNAPVPILHPGPPGPLINTRSFGNH